VYEYNTNYHYNLVLELRWFTRLSDGPHWARVRLQEIRIVYEICFYVLVKNVHFVYQKSLYYLINLVKEIFMHYYRMKYNKVIRADLIKEEEKMGE
jgi:hypothetical protein